jgi:hypothetical protein
LKLKFPTYNSKSRNLHRSRRPTNPRQKYKSQHQNGKSLKTEKLTGKPPSLHLHLQNTKPLQICLLILVPCLFNPNETQGQTNRKIFKDQEVPLHISNSASKDNSRTTNSHHNSQRRPVMIIKVEMAEATSSKRQSNGDTNNAKKKSLIH